MSRNLSRCNLNIQNKEENKETRRRKKKKEEKEELVDMCQLQYLYSEFILLTLFEILEKLGVSVKSDPRQFQLT